MKTRVSCLVLTAFATAALAGGPMLISVEQTQTGLQYRHNGKPITLPDLQLFVKSVVDERHKLSPELEFPIDIVPVGSLVTEHLIPVLRCLKQAGVARCTIDLSSKVGEADYWVAIEVDLRQLLETQGDRRMEMMRRWGTAHK